jgi:hypothetical protein
MSADCLACFCIGVGIGILLTLGLCYFESKDIAGEIQGKVDDLHHDIIGGDGWITTGREK